jgi:hypothetical protein
MSSVQSLPLHAGGDAAASAGVLEATPAFHVVLGADGSVAIERSHDEDAGAAVPEMASTQSGEPALPATLESSLPALHTARPSMRGESAPARQLRWSFAGGALVATVALVAGHQLFERWSEAATASRLATSAAPEARAVPLPATAGPPSTAIAETPAPQPMPPVAIALPIDPPAAGRPARAGRSVSERDVAPPPAPAPQPGVGPCTAAVAALALCDPAQIQERP